MSHFGPGVGNEIKRREDGINKMRVELENIRTKIADLRRRLAPIVKERDANYVPKEILPALSGEEFNTKGEQLAKYNELNGQANKLMAEIEPLDSRVKEIRNQIEEFKLLKAELSERANLENEIKKDLPQNLYKETGITWEHPLGEVVSEELRLTEDGAKQLVELLNYGSFKDVSAKKNGENYKFVMSTESALEGLVNCRMASGLSVSLPWRIKSFFETHAEKTKWTNEIKSKLPEELKKLTSLDWETHSQGEIKSDRLPKEEAHELARCLNEAGFKNVTVQTRTGEYFRVFMSSDSAVEKLVDGKMRPSYSLSLKNEFDAIVAKKRGSLKL